MTHRFAGHVSTKLDNDPNWAKDSLEPLLRVGDGKVVLHGVGVMCLIGA